MSTLAVLNRHIPVLSWARAYVPQWFKLDLLAGVITSAVLIPKAMAFATIAGLPVQVGLYTSFVALLVYAALGTSRPLSVSTTTTISNLAGAQLALAIQGDNQNVVITAAATLALMVGIVLIIASVLRLGFLTNFISEPVLTGFKAGVGIVIIVDQIPKLLGIHFHKGTFVQNAFQTVAHLPETAMATLALGLFTLALIFLLEHYLPHVPAPLVAAGIGIALSAMGLEKYGVETVGTVERGLPSLVAPDWSLAETLWPGALGIALMSYTESVAAMRAFAKPDEPRPDPNQELLAIGAANVASGLVGGMPAGGGTTQTAVNRRMGARTQLSGVVAAAVCIATLILLAPLIGLMPVATLSAIVVAYSIELIHIREFMEIRRIRGTEFWWAVIAVAGIVMFGTLRGILVAVIASLASLMQQANNPPVYAVGRKRGTDEYLPLTGGPDDEIVPGLLIVHVDGRMYFGNVQKIFDKVHHLIDEHHPRTLILDCRAIIDLEFSALKMLIHAEKTLRLHGITLWVVAPNPQVETMLERSTLGETLGKDRIFHRLHPAVERYKATQLGK